MIEQPALVAAVRRHIVWVRRCATTDCRACAAGTGCGAGWLLRWFGGATAPPVAVVHSSSERFTDGDRIVMSVPERGLLLIAGVVYGAPVAGLLSGAVLGDRLGGETGAIALGVAGLAAGAVLIRAMHTRLASICPVDIRRARATERAPDESTVTLP